MGRRTFSRLGLAALALVVALLGPAVALAGGVAVTFDRPPADVQAGIAFSFGFTIRSAHEGNEPQPGLAPFITATNNAADKQVTTTAKAEGAPGHYVASLTFPVAGAWQWQIEPFGKTADYRQALPGPLEVREQGAAPAAAPPVAATAEVTGNDTTFGPTNLSIAAGTAVTWQMTGKFPHTVKADDASFASGNIEAGGAYTFTFITPGTYRYYCEYHGSTGGLGMAGIITVSAAMLAAAPAVAPPAAPPVAAPAAVQPAAPAAVAVAPAQPEAALPATGEPNSPLFAVLVVALVVGVAGVGLWVRSRRAA